MLRRHLRGIAIAVETLLRLSADAAGVAVERLAPPFSDRGPAESWADTPLPDGRPKGQPYTIADIEAMRSAGPEAWLKRRGLLQHAPGCVPIGCVYGCPVAERGEDLREAGYTSTGSDEIRDDEATRSKILNGEPVDMSKVIRIAAPGPCGSQSPAAGPDYVSYACELTSGHSGDHRASGDENGEWCETWTGPLDELKR